jgi:hypothetical protein
MGCGYYYAGGVRSNIALKNRYRKSLYTKIEAFLILYFEKGIKN